MSNLSIIPVRALYDNRMSADDISLLNVVCIHTDEDGYCFPSLETISGIFSPLVGRPKPYDDSTISRKLSRLEGFGYLASPVQRHTTGGGFSSNQYKVLYDVELPLEFDRRKMQTPLAKSRRKIQAALENASVKKQTNAPVLTPQINDGAKPAPVPEDRKPRPKSPAAEKGIALARSAIQEWERKNDEERERDAALSDPRKEKRVFVRQISPLVARVLNRGQAIGEDRAATGEIFEFHCDAGWLTERLTAYANGSGDEFRSPGKDGKKPNAYWVRNRIEREWAEYRQEKQDAEQHEREQADYERRCAAALAGDAAPEQESGGSHSDSVHLHDPAGGPGGNAVRDEAGQAGIAVAAGGELRVRGDGLGVLPMPRPPVGTMDGPGEAPEPGRSVREMYRDYKMRRHLAAVDAEISKRKQGQGGADPSD